MKISIVLANAYGMGGTIRTVFNMAGGLSQRHEVEIVSLAQHRASPFFPVPDGVTLTTLAPSRGWAGRPRQGLLARWRESRPTSVVPNSETERNGAFSGRTEHAMRRFLRNSDSDVVIGTRPGINLLLARWAPDRILAIGQEHVHLGAHKKDVRAAAKRLYPKLDGLIVLTETDRAAYRAFLPGGDDWAVSMPNTLPPGDYPRSSLENPIIVAAGRLSKIKQYPKLLRAFAVVAEAHPEWRLRIYGGGRAKDRLLDVVHRLGLADHVAIMGRTKDLAGELAKASILAVSSRAEGFGMTIIEGFAVGIPAVSFDCPHGPREIITHERDGLLVPHQDVDALAEGLLRLVENPEERAAMGMAAVAAAGRYDLQPIVLRWEEYLQTRIAAKKGAAQPVRAA